MNKIHLSSVDSTNTYLKANYQKLNNYTFVSTDIQSSGRGRNNRIWKSENGKNLLFSLLILDEELMKHYKAISVITAYSLIQTLESYHVNNLSIKWPNDIFVNDHKICGILLESIIKDKMECLIIGVGLNVNQKNFNDEFLINPTSLSKELNKDIDIEELKDKIYFQLIFNLNKLKDGYDYYPLIKKYDYLKGKKAYAFIKDEKTEVEIVGINNDYSLSINNNGSIDNVESGEISFHI